MKKSKKYKIVFGYNTEEYIPIDESELERAQHAFDIGARASFRSGSVDFARKNVVIQPDYHAFMGWNRGHILGPEDYQELSQKGVDRAHEEYHRKVREKVKYLRDNDKADLIGKNIDIPELDSGKKYDRVGKTATVGELIGDTG